MNLPPVSIQKQLSVTFTVCLFAAVSLHARIGERRSELEGRLLADRLAIKVPTRMQDRLLNDRSVPYKWIYEYLPEGVVMEIYYKAADAEAKENAPDSLKGF